MYEILSKFPNKLTSFLPEVWVANKMKITQKPAIIDNGGLCKLDKPNKKIIKCYKKVNKRVRFSLQQSL